MPLIDLTNENFDEQIETSKMAILDFWAPWCNPCKAFAPIFEAAALAHPDILFARVNTDEETILSEQFAVRSVPTILASVDGTITHVKLGALLPEKLEELIQQMRQT